MHPSPGHLAETAMEGPLMGNAVPCSIFLISDPPEMIYFPIPNFYQRRRTVKRFAVVTAWLMLFGVSALFAQEGAKKDSCCGEEAQSQEKCSESCSELQKLICPEKDGKCDDKCKAACENACKTVQAAMGRLMERCKKEGLKCDKCKTDEKGTFTPCDACKAMVKDVVAPWVKKQMAAKDATHTSKGADGKEVTTKCTLTSGPVCDGCATAIGDMLFAKCKEMCESQKTDKK